MINDNKRLFNFRTRDWVNKDVLVNTSLFVLVCVVAITVNGFALFMESISIYRLYLALGTLWPTNDIEINAVLK